MVSYWEIFSIYSRMVVHAQRCMDPADAELFQVRVSRSSHAADGGLLFVAFWTRAWILTPGNHSNPIECVLINNG